MEIMRVTARWTGFPGAPGYSNFHFSTDPGFWDGGIIGDSAQAAADSALARVRDAFEAANLLLFDGLRIVYEPTVEVLDSVSGEILGAVDAEEVAETARGVREDFVGPAGAVVNWRTNQYRAGRRIRGRTFLVPIASASYEADGTLTSAARDAARDFGSTMISGGGDPVFGVWSRPRGGDGGVFAPVSAATVPDMAAVLRSRRD